VNVTVKPSPVKPALHFSDNYIAGKCPGENPVRLYTQPVEGYQYMWQKDGVPLSGQNSPFIDFYEPGLYRLIADINGCTEISDVKNADFPVGPEKPVIYAEGPSAWYLACSILGPDYSYKWYYNEKLIGGADKYYYMANRNLGVYRVSVGDANGCFSSDSIRIPLVYTSVNHPEETGEPVIYPNPGKGIFNLAFESQQTGTVDIRIASISGSVIKNLKFEKATYHFSTIIDITGWPRGNYLLFTNLNGRTTVRKIIME
jgi:hypothetical protein